MQVNLENFKEIRTPIYVLEESRLRQNLSLIKSVADRADMEIIRHLRLMPFGRLSRFSENIFLRQQQAL